MNCVITIDMGNAAFELGHEGEELSRILADLAERIPDNPGNYIDHKEALSLHDSNGNHVGEAVFRRD